MKSLINKLFAIIFIAVLTAGCASSLTAPIEKIEKEKPQVETVEPGDVLKGESGVHTSKMRPDL